MMKFSKFSLLIITLLWSVVVCGQSKTSKSAMTVSTVVIDAGHGGKDPGCVYKQVHEKDINLSIALLFGEMIKDNFPDVKVIYTRKTDVFVELSERGNIANKANADLFLSIHVDALGNSSASGNSSYIMGLDKENKNLDVAMRENDVITFEDDYSTKYEGYVPGSEESFIIFSLMQYAFQQQSMMFAELIQQNYKKTTSLPDRGARQAPYLVLWNTAMPSVLTETGFMSNGSDREFLTSKAGQKKVATALFNAFSQYKSRTEGRSQTIILNADASSTDTVGADKQSTQSTNTVEQTTAKSAVASAGSVKYFVQLCTLSSKPDPNSSAFKSFRGKVTVKTTPNGSFRCLVGGTADYNEAVKLQAEARKEFKGAFVAAFAGEEYISVSEARSRQQ